LLQALCGKNNFPQTGKVIIHGSKGAKALVLNEQ